MPAVEAPVALPLAPASWKIPPLIPVDLELAVVGRDDLVYELVVTTELILLLILLVLLTVLLLVLWLLVLVLLVLVLVLVVLVLDDVVELVVEVDEEEVDEVEVEEEEVEEVEVEEVVASATRPLTAATAEFTAEVTSSTRSEPEELEEEDPVLKTVICADPEVTVTTQKSAPPAPDAASSLVTPP